MWSLFKKEPVLSDEDLRFQIECYKWLLTHFGGDSFHKEAKLILPTKDFFPTEVNSQIDAAEATFDYVKKYAGMEKWPCKLIKQGDDPNLVVSPTVVLQNVEL